MKKQFLARVCPALLLSLALIGTGCARSPEAKKAAFLASGKTFLEQKEYPKALLQFKNAAQVAPRDAEPYYQMALTELEMGDGQTSVALLRKVLELNPTHQGAQIRMAALKSSTKDPKLMGEAEVTLKQVVATSPNDLDAVAALSLAEARLGKVQDAADLLQPAVTKAPNHIVAATLLATEKLSLGDQAGARAVLEKLVQDNPKSTDARLLLGQFHLRLGHLDLAEPPLQDALKIDPKYAPALLELTQIKMKQGKTDEVEQLLQRISALPKSEYKPLHAEFLFSQGRRDDAVKEMEQLVKANSQDRSLRTRLISSYLATNRSQQAISTLSDVLKSNPKDSEALQQRAQVFRASGKLQEAQDDLMQVLRLKPDSAEAHLLLAGVRHDQGQALSQRQELTEALKINPKLLAARLELADVLLAGKSAQAALELLDAAPAEQQKMLPAITKRNTVLLALGQTDAAQKGVAEGLALQRTPDLLLQEAQLEGMKHNLAGARKSVEEVLEKNPGHLPALMMLAGTYVQEKQIPAGVAKVKEYAAKQPKNAPVQQYLGDVLLQTGDKDGARAAYQAALSATPDHLQPSVMLARMDLQDGRLNEARQRLNEVLQRQPKMLEANLWMAMLEQQANNIPAAVARYRTAIDLDRNNVFALNNLAALLMNQQGNADEALKYAQQATELAPNNPSVQDTIGWAYYQKAIYPTALRYLKTAAETSKEPAIHYHLAMAYVKSGDRVHGEQTLAAVSKIAPNSPEAAQAQSVFAQAR